MRKFSAALLLYFGLASAALAQAVTGSTVLQSRPPGSGGLTVDDLSAYTLPTTIRQVITVGNLTIGDRVQLTAQVEVAASATNINVANGAAVSGVVSWGQLCLRKVP